MTAAPIAVVFVIGAVRVGAVEREVAAMEVPVASVAKAVEPSGMHSAWMEASGAMERGATVETTASDPADTC